MKKVNMVKDTIEILINLILIMTNKWCATKSTAVCNANGKMLNIKKNDHLKSIATLLILFELIFKTGSKPCTPLKRQGDQ